MLLTANWQWRKTCQIHMQNASSAELSTQVSKLGTSHKVVTLGEPQNKRYRKGWGRAVNCITLYAMYFIYWDVKVICLGWLHLQVRLGNIFLERRLGRAKWVTISQGPEVFLKGTKEGKKWMNIYAMQTRVVYNRCELYDWNSLFLTLWPNGQLWL